MICVTFHISNVGGGGGEGGGGGLGGNSIGGGDDGGGGGDGGGDGGIVTQKSFLLQDWPPEQYDVSTHPTYLLVVPQSCGS